MKYEILINGVKRAVEFGSSGSSAITAVIDGRNVSADVVQISPSVYSILLGGRSLEVTVEKGHDAKNGDAWVLRTSNREFQVQIIDPRSWRRGGSGSLQLEGRQQITAPMPGKVVRLLVKPGQQVETGQGLLVIEAMKMQNEIRSPKAGTVERLAKEAQTVNAGEVVAIVA